MGGPIATKISLGETDAVTLAGKFEPDELPHEVDDGAFDVPREEHTGTVTWTAPIRFSADATLADLTIPVKFYYQACASSCLRPTTERVTASYSGELTKAPGGEAMAVKEPGVAESSTPEKKVDDQKAETKHAVSHDSPEDIAAMASLYDASSKINYVPLYAKAKTTLLTALFGAFVGGFLLNLMPCVFPVLGIKVCLLYTSPSPRDATLSRMPSSA